MVGLRGRGRRLRAGDAAGHAVHPHHRLRAAGSAPTGGPSSAAPSTTGSTRARTGSFAGGWWRADYSSFCNGTRYYIDCMQNCCGSEPRQRVLRRLHRVPLRAVAATPAASTATTSGTGSATRRSGSPARSPAASSRAPRRTPTPSMACSTAAAVDNRTAEHTPAHGCTPPPPPPVVVLPRHRGVRRPRRRARWRCSTGGAMANINAFLSNGGAFTGGVIGPGRHVRR